MNGLPSLEPLWGIDQRPSSTGVDWNTAKIASLESGNSMQCPLGLPGISSI